MWLAQKELAWLPGGSAGSWAHPAPNPLSDPPGVEMVELSHQISFAAPSEGFWDWLEWLKSSCFVSFNPFTAKLGSLAVGFVSSAAQQNFWFFVLGFVVCFFFYFNFLSLFKQDLESWTNLFAVETCCLICLGTVFHTCLCLGNKLLGVSVLCCNSSCCVEFWSFLRHNWCSSHPSNSPKLTLPLAGFWMWGLGDFFGFISSSPPPHFPSLMWIPSHRSHLGRGWNWSPWGCTVNRILEKLKIRGPDGIWGFLVLPFGMAQISAAPLVWEAGGILSCGAGKATTQMQLKNTLKEKKREDLEGIISFILWALYWLLLS